MASTGERRALILVAGTDLLLVGVVGSPWFTDWALSGLFSGSNVKQAAAELIFPGWGAGDRWELAAQYEDWRVGTILRILAFVLLHLWVVRWLIRRTAVDSRPAWRGARTAAWVFGPVAGVLAGLATVISGAFDPSTTVEERKALRFIAIDSMEDGAYWGLFAGAVCGIALTIASRFMRRSAQAANPEADDGGEMPRLIGCLPVFMAPALAMVATVAVVTFAGGPAIVKAGIASSDELGGPDAGARLADLVSYLHWWVPQEPGGDRNLALVPPIALGMYLLILLVLLMTNLGELGDGSRRRQRRYPPTLPLTNPDTLATSPGLMAFAKGWQAATWAAIVAAFVVAELTTVITFFMSSTGGQGSGLSVLASIFFDDELPKAAAYTALLGWVPGLAVLAAARLLRRLLGWVAEAQAEAQEEAKPAGVAQSDTELTAEN